MTTAGAFPTQSDGCGDAVPACGEVASAARAAGEDLDQCLRFADWLGPLLPQPGSGQTRLRWQLLAAAGSGDLTAARVLEPHADALAILAEAGSPTRRGVWGVFAAEAARTSLEAKALSGTWRLSGRKPWCSLAARLDRALVTANTADGRRLYAVDLHHPGVTTRSGTWVARGLRRVDSGPVDFVDVPAEPVGEEGWYLRRPGFSWGGLGVAACWLGGARALVGGLVAGLAQRPAEPLRSLNLGRADLALWSATRCLNEAASRVDNGRAAGEVGELLALRVRAIVADAVETILTEVGHALGPAPMAFDEAHARRVADLQIYVRQHHAERDVASIGSRLLSGDDSR